MPVYTYTAVDANGKSVRGRITASNELDLEDRLESQGFMLMVHKAEKPKKSWLFSPINPKELLMFCVHMEQMERAGVPILDALADLRDSSENPTFRDVMADIYENIKGGEVLSAALKKRPDVFSEIFVGLISAGESTGEISTAFGHMANHLRWTVEFRRKIRKAISYPIGLVVVMTALITLMMTFVVPQLIKFITEQDFEIPGYTQALIATSDAFVHYWYIILGLPILGLAGLITLYRGNEAVRYVMDSFFLRLPVLGQVLLKINIARFSRFFALTFNSGIGVLECLDTARKVVNNRVIKESVTHIIQSVSEGVSLTRSISATERFPSLVVRMFKVGEDTGNMEEALENINFFYDREVEDSIDQMIGIIKPTLIIVMGGILFWIIAAVFGPLYGSFSKIDVF